MQLTIGIPTCKRPEYLREALLSIFENISEKHSRKIEILIADNEPGSTETKDMVLQYQKEFPELISYYQHDVNIGYDANVSFIFTKAQGEYVWLLSDDDAMIPGAINKVLSVLNSYSDISIIFVNYQQCDENLDKKNHSDNNELTEDSLCISAIEFIEKSHFLFGLISSLVFSKKNWLKYYDKDYLNTTWIHVGMALSVLIKAPKSFVIHDKLVLFRVQKNNRSSFWCSQGNQYFTPAKSYCIYEKMKAIGYEPKTYRPLINSYYNTILVSLLCVVRDGANFSLRLNIIRDLISKHSLRLRTWFLYIPILFLPSFLVRKVYSLYKFF